MVIYFAILLHKLPTSVGLGSFLKGSGSTETNSLKSIAWFTLSSPISTIFFYLLLCTMPDNSPKDFNMPLVLGVLLLVSAGTFLYVATIHILPETF